MIELAAKANRLDHWIHLSTEFRADLGWWQAFLPKWNRRCMMRVIDKSGPPDIVLFSDASGSWCCGAIWGNHWLQWEWEDLWVYQQITVKELAPIVAACTIWGYQWQNMHVLVRCDNMAVVQVLLALSSKEPTIMHLLRCLYYFLALYNIHIIHIRFDKFEK